MTEELFSEYALLVFEVPMPPHPNHQVSAVESPRVQDCAHRFRLFLILLVTSFLLPLTTFGQIKAMHVKRVLLVTENLPFPAVVPLYSQLNDHLTGVLNLNPTRHVDVALRPCLPTHNMIGTVLNREAPTSETYSAYIVVAGLVFVLQTLLIVALLRQRTKKRRVEKSLAERLAFETLLYDLSSIFIDLPDDEVTPNLEAGLTRIAEFLNLDRIALFECSEENIELIATSSPPKDAEHFPPEVTPVPWPWWTSRALRGGPETLTDVDVPADTGSHVREFLSKSGIRSITSVPLRAGGEVVGAISFISTSRRVLWTEDLVKQLKALAEIFSNALERKRAMEALNARQAELTEAQRLAKVGSWRWDPETDTVTWSEELYRMAGLDPSMPAVSYKDHPKLYTAESWQRLRTAVEEALRTGTPYELDLEMIRFDGERRWLTARGEAHRDATGRVTQLRGTVQDITERKKIEEALRESETRLRLAQEGVHVGVFEWDIQKNQTFSSGERDRIYGLEPGSFGKTYQEWIERIHPDDRERIEREVREHVEKGGIADTEFRIIRPSGEVRWLFSRGHVYRDSAGSPFRMLGVSIDITERKAAEEALRESEDRFRLVANTAPVMIWMSGTDKLCTYFNKPWLDFTGGSLQSEMGNGWAEGVHPDEINNCLQTYTKAFDRRETFQMEYRLRRHDGVYRWVLDYGVPRFNSDGSFAGYIGSCIDITERKLADEALSSVSRRLIEAHEEERTRIARELHDDINQRLALLEIDLEHLELGFPGSRAEFPVRLREVRQRLSETASEIQAISHRLHSSKLEYLGIVAAAKTFCREMSVRHKVEIAFSHDAVSRDLPYDVSLCLFRVLQEALHNAVKHSGVRRFDVTLYQKSREVELTVRDAGKGFEPAAAQTNPGLGLISMQERVKLVNGKISIISEPGRGTTILVHLPLRVVLETARAATK